jgi:uncharacterized alpha-E superfamily protein
MLSRVADALFWMSRYLERAETVARLLDVCFHLELDLHGVLTGPHELQWTTLAAILFQNVPPAKAGTSPQTALSNWLTFDLENPTSILSCVTRARFNARSIRGTLNSEMWKELNKLYWLLCDPEFVRRAKESPYEFYQAVEGGSRSFQGVCDATLTHDEGWQFIQLGKFLERADKTLRILDIQHQLLHELTHATDAPMANLQWAAVLRSCNAFEAFQKLYVGRVEPERVVEFLLLHPQFPRSVRFSLEAAAQALSSIETLGTGRGMSKADRTLGRLLNDLKFAELDQVRGADLHAFLGDLWGRVAQVGRAVHDQYSLR